MANALYYVMIMAIVFIGIAYFTQGQNIMAANAPNNTTVTGQQYEKTMQIIDLNSTLFPALLFLGAGYIVWRVVVGGGES